MPPSSETERDLILQEYSADYDDEIPAQLLVYLSITPEIHYQIQLNFETYPEPPTILLPQDLEAELGKPRRFLIGLRQWNTKSPPHIVEIIRELEELLHRIIIPNSEMEQVMMEFKSHMSAPYRLHVLLYSYKMKTYEFEIFHKKPNRPTLSFTPELHQILKPEELYTLPKWPRVSLIDICREISKKIDNRTRIMDELKQLDKKEEYRKNIRRSFNRELVIDIHIEIETGESCEIEIKLTDEFPIAPPNIELKNLSSSEIKNDLNTLLLEHYNQWQNATTILEIVDNVKNFMMRKSKQICQICHRYKCPKCTKPIFTKIRGISGENECKTHCPSCSATFHKCCWTAQLKFTRKCPVCLTQKTIYY